jgi:organic radical activating enzyme
MLNITQIIPTVQCEGPNIGTPCVLIRFGGCNLKCDFCDTKFSAYEYKSSNYNIDINIIDDIFKEYPNINTFMFTGGEPFLHLDSIYEICKLYKNKINNFEIETNGTLFNKDNMLKLNSITNLLLLNSNDVTKFQINISPKLQDSYHRSNNYVQVYLESLSQFYKYISDSLITDYCLKFVYDKLKEHRYKEFIDRFIMKKNKIYFMPLTPDINDYNQKLLFYIDFVNSCKETICYCLKNNYKYSPREHVFVFGEDIDEKLDCKII